LYTAPGQAYPERKTVVDTIAIDYREPCEFQPLDTFSHRRLSGALSLQKVLACLDDLRQADPGYRYLCTLDDLNQSCYTSGHAGNDERLELDYGDTDFDDPASVHAYEVRRLAHIAAQLRAPALRQSWENVCGTLATTQDDIAVLIDTNRDPDQVLDTVVYVQRLAVPEDELLIAGLPNGYFSCDWDVFQNHAVIRRMHAQHAYRFFGIGASWLGFVRDAPLSAVAADALVADLADLYGCSADEYQTAWRELAEIAVSGNVLLLGYTENFAE
jgi:hypothetical protein